MQQRVHRDGVPWITIAVGVCLLVTGLNQHFNELRTVPASTDRLPQRQIDFAAAVERWKKANDCTNGSCPPALVIAIDGGASRAAFAAATFVGEILDRMPPVPERPRPAPARRIFAMSGVSGGSVGAVAIRTALVDAMHDPTGAPPCRNAYRTWFRVEEFGRGKPKFTWRDCLQALVTGDYLSPVFIGLGFRDNLAPARYIVNGPSLLDDRAALLERAFERHYEAVLGDRGAAIVGSRGSGDGPGRATALRIPATRLRGWTRRQELAAVAFAQRDLGPDRTSDHHIGSSSTYLDKTNKPAGFYSQAYDLFEMMSSPCKVPDLPARIATLPILPA